MFVIAGCPTYKISRYIATEPLLPGDQIFYTTDKAECIRACSDHDLCTVVAYDLWNSTCQIYRETEYTNMTTINKIYNQIFDITCLGTLQIVLFVIQLMKVVEECVFIQTR